MKPRDRLFLTVVLAAAALVAVYMAVVSPERKQAATLSAQVATAQQSLSSAQASLTSAEAAKAQYPAAYASMVSVGKAVPGGEDVPSLIYQLDQASHAKDVSFESITAGGGTSSSSASAVATGGFQSLPFTFAFDGTYFALYHLLNRLNTFTVQAPNGQLTVTGRLLAIQSTALTQVAGTNDLKGTITATAYVLPQSSTAATGATPSGPGGTAAASTTPSSTPSTSSTAPAVVLAPAG